MKDRFWDVWDCVDSLLWTLWYLVGDRCGIVVLILFYFAKRFRKSF